MALVKKVLFIAGVALVAFAIARRTPVVKDYL